MTGTLGIFMLQILSNYLFIFIVPFLLGFSLRLLIRKSRKPSILTVCFIVLAIIMWGIAVIVPSHGSELNGLRAMQTSCLAVGAFIAGLITRARL